MLKPVAAEPRYEDLFVERYVQLRQWALRLTGRDTWLADDLLHDAFVQLVVGRPDLGRIESLDRYLYGMLRNLHLSRIRRVARRQEVSLGIVDYDSAAVGLRAADAAARAQLLADLWCAVRYVSDRAAASMTASAFALRFFHGYYPAEIARLAARPRATVDTWLSVARAEVARALSAGPQGAGLGFADARRRSSGADGADNDVLRDMQRALFAVRDACVAHGRIGTVYATPARPVSGTVLRHLAHCAGCLDAASLTLGLPGVASRSAAEHIDPSPRAPRGPGGRGSGGAGPVSLTSFRQRARDVVEHQPKELRVLVNGFQLGALHVSAARNVLDLSASLPEPIGCIEIVSEQHVRLMWLDVTPPPAGEAEQWADVMLADGRAVQLAIRFSTTWPAVHLVYLDPLRGTSALTDVVETSEQDEVNSERAVLFQPPHAKNVGARLWARLASAWSPSSSEPSRRRAGQHPFDLRRPAMAMLLLVTLLVASAAAASPRLRAVMADAAHAAWRWIGREEPPVPSRPLTIPSHFPAAPRHVAPVDAAPIVLSSPPVSRAEIVGLEIRALEALHRTGALLGEQIDVVVRGGIVHVDGLLVDDHRKRAVIAAMADLVSSPYVRVNVRSIGEVLAAAQQRPRETTSSASVRDADIAPNRVAAYDSLRRHFAAKSAGGSAAGVTADVEREINGFATRAVGRSREALYRALALRKLASRYAGEDLRLVNPDAFRVWRGMIADEARAFGDEVAALRHQLAEVFVPRIEGELAARDTPMRGDGDELRHGIDQLVGAAERVHEAVRSALIASASAPARAVDEPAPPSAIEQDGFWTAVAEALRLAERLQ